MVLVDTGADLSIIKLSSLDEDILVSQNEAIEIAEITQNKMSTLGTFQIRIKNSKVTFHVTEPDFPINTDGILRREYLRRENVEILFWHNTIVTHANPTKPVPFIDEESKIAKENMEGYKGTSLGPIQIKARTKRVIPVEGINKELKEGYLLLIKVTEGVLVGEAAVTNTNGICHVLAINTTEKDLSIEIPPQELIPFEYYDLPGEDSDEYFLTKNLKFKREKIKEVIGKF